MHFCHQHSKRILNPIIDWTTDEVWEFIHENNIPYCKLYDEGFKRLGCIGCPMSGTSRREREFNRWPKYRNLYIQAFDKMIAARAEGGRRTESLMQESSSITGYQEWNSAEKVFEWWMNR